MAHTQAKVFRQTFQLPLKLAKWFPGHMNRGIRVMKQHAQRTDCFIEIHDARIPFCGRATSFREFLTGSKPHILVLNKSDLVSLSVNEKDTIERRILSRRDANQVIWLSSKPGLREDNNTGKILNSALKLIHQTHRPGRSDRNDYNCMIIGIPNVGKSTVINRLRQLHVGSGSPAPVGKNAGFTKHVTTRICICHNPPIYLFDTPGVLEPRYGSNVEEVLKVGLCGSLDDDQMDLITIADYLLFILNKKENFSYVPHLGIDEPTDSINELIIKTCIAKQFLINQRELDGSKAVRPDTTRAIRIFIDGFRSGLYGCHFLDGHYFT